MISQPTHHLPIDTAVADGDGDARARTGTQFLRLLVHQSGSQRTSVTITERHDRPVLHVRAGAVFVYAGSPEVVAAHLVAWRDTVPAARHLLAADASVLPVQDAAAAITEVSVIVRQDAAPAMAITRFPADPARPGRPACIETVTGPLTTRSYDRQSIADVFAAWMQAAALGAIVWASPTLADL